MRPRETLRQGMAVQAFLDDIHRGSRTSPFNPAEEIREVIIEGEVTAEDLMGLLHLPCEVSITELNGVLVLKTGTRDSAPPPDDFRGKSRVFLHTHRAHGVTHADSPSLVDAKLHVDPATPLLLAHSKGMTLFQMPIRNPVTGKPIEENQDIRDVIIGFAESKGISLFGGAHGLKDYHEDLGADESEALDHEFAEKSGMIVKEAAWSDGESLQLLLDILNLRSDVKEVAILQQEFRRRMFSGMQAR